MSTSAETVHELNAERGKPLDGTPHLQGYIDAIEPDRVYGWAWNSSDPSERLMIEIRQGEQLIVRLEANQPRPDLVSNGIGDGRYAFIANVAAIGEIDRASPITVLAIGADGDSAIELKRQTPTQPASNVNAAVIGEIRARDQRLQGQLRQLVSVAKERDGLDQELHERLTESLGKLDMAVPELERRIGALEVFELRFDTLLQKVDKRLSMMEIRSRPKPSLLLWLWCGLATLVSFGFLAYHLLFRGA
ncbi:hypothetical protein [Dongia sp.]|uniref:hypothetical protein n=1 Tax=Dongia sp. TaxID=1977262 RepID=UPI0035B373FE